MTRRLIVMRHAKAEPFAATDHERRLTERGERDAADAGAYLARSSMVPDHAVVSSAARAVATWNAVAQAAGADAETTIDDAVFAGSSDVVLQTLRSVPGEAQLVIFVGHNPTAATLVHQLDDGNGSPEAVHQLLQGFPAGALTVLEVDVPWSELAPETARVVDFYVSRG